MQNEDVFQNNNEKIGRVAVIFNSKSGNFSVDLIKKEIDGGFDDYKIFELKPKEDLCELTKKHWKKVLKPL